MKQKAARAAAVVALALLGYFQFPGHTWLAQDSQIYAALLEHQHDPAVLANDPLVRHPHLAFTIYDELAEAVRRLSGLSLHATLALEQIAARAIGIWGVDLMAGPLAAAVYALGAPVAGPAIFTVEYEPTPRAIALPLLLLAIGLAFRRRYGWSAIAAAIALLYHPPTCWPVLIVLTPLLAVRREWRALAILTGAAALLVAIGLAQGGMALGGTIPDWLETLQRMRAVYAWISLWPFSYLWHWLVVLAVATGAFLRVRQFAPDLARFWLALAVIGILSLPASWLLLEHAGLALLPQLQPMRAAVFTLLAMQLLATPAAAHALSKTRWVEAGAWLFAAFLPPLAPVFPAGTSVRRLLVCAALAGLTLALWRLSPKLAPASALAAMFAIPALASVVNYVPVENRPLDEVSTWARHSTPRDAVFLFPDIDRGLQPGVFRANALRAVYVDWKSGGQINFWPDFARVWWTRWQATQDASDLARLRSLGIRFLVLHRRRLARPALFQNEDWAVYDLGG